MTVYATDEAPATDHHGDGCWIDLAEAAIDDLDEIAERFELHELAVEDAQHAHQRPKLERYGDTIVVVAKPAVYDDEQEAIDVGELLVVVGPSFVVSVRHGVGHDVLRRSGDDDHVERSLDGRPPVRVLHQLLDAVVDDYQPVLEGLQTDIHEIEDDVFSVERSNPAPRIYSLKRHVLDMLRNLEPLMAPLDELAHGTDLDGHDEELDEYFRDVADHLRRLVGRLDTINSVLSDVLQAHLAQVSMTQNDDMRRMSAWAAIFLLPTLLAGLWGMNFEHMPELDWTFGYPLALVVMVGASGFLWWRFRCSGWLGRPRPTRPVVER